MLGMSWLRVLSETQVFIFVPRLSGTSHVVFQNAGVAVVLFLLDFFFSIEGKENLLPLSPAKFHYSFFCRSAFLRATSLLAFGYLVLPSLNKGIISSSFLESKSTSASNTFANPV